MKLIIDIPTKDYNVIKSIISMKDGTGFHYLANLLISAVKNGEEFKEAKND